MRKKYEVEFISSFEQLLKIEKLRSHILII